MTDLGDEMIVAGTIEITMQGKVAQSFPWRFVAMHVHRVGLTTGRNGSVGQVVTHGGGGHHGYPGHGAVSQFATLLKIRLFIMQVLLRNLAAPVQ